MLPTHQRMPQAYFPYYNNAIQTHFPYKSLSYPHHVLLESTINPFFYMKNKHHMLPPPQLSAILTTMCMEFPFASNFTHTLHISTPIVATKLTMASLPLILFYVGILNVHTSPNLVLTLGTGGRGWGIGWGDYESKGGCWGLVVSSGGYSLEETASDLTCEEAWLNLMSMENGKKNGYGFSGYEDGGMKMEWNGGGHVHGNENRFAWMRCWNKLLQWVWLMEKMGMKNKRCGWWWIWWVMDFEGFWGVPCTPHSFFSNKLSTGEWKP